MSGKESNTKNNYSFSILKIVMSFVVVTCHFYDGTGIFAYPEKLAVPVFIALTFFFKEEALRHKCDRINVRNLLRLIIPGVIWGGIYYLASIVMHNGSTIKDLIIQFLLGSSHLINPTLWYLYDTAFVLAIFALLQRIGTGKNTFLWYRLILLGFSIFFQYSGLNYSAFSSLPQGLYYSAGRLFEIIPAACIGSIMSDAIDCLKKKEVEDVLTCGRGYVVFLLCIFICITLYYFKPYNPSGFGYQGIAVIFSVILLLLSFYYIYIPDEIHQAIVFLQRYGLGIYCIHMSIGKILELVFPKINLQTGTMLFCLLIWILCIVACVAIDKFSRGRLRFLIC